MKTDSFSRFKRTEMVIVNGHETFGLWSKFDFLKTRPPEDLIKVFSVTSANEGRPDLISHQVYGTPFLDWVLLAFNGVRDPMNWPINGMIIEYPVDSVVIPELY